MKKFSTLLLTSAMVCSMSVGVFGNTIQATYKGNVNDKTINGVKVYGIPLGDKSGYYNLSLEDLCKELGQGNNNCYQLNGCIIHDNNFPGIDKPEINWPDFDKPEIDKPEIDKPEIDKPEIDKPDNSLPELPPSDDNTDKPVVDSEYAAEVVRLVNEERAKEGLAPLSVQSGVQAAAQTRAMEQQKSFSHTRPNGSHFSTALTENGVSYRGSGENIAYGQTSPEQVMKGWMNSSGHRANIMNKNFTTIGVGYYEGTNGTPYWAQLFTN